MRDFEIKVKVSETKEAQPIDEDKPINRLIYLTDQLEKCDKRIAKLKNDLGYNNIKRMMIKHKLNQLEPL